MRSLTGSDPPQKTRVGQTVTARSIKDSRLPTFMGMGLGLEMEGKMGREREGKWELLGTI
jgi:hypothetical protein